MPAVSPLTARKTWRTPEVCHSLVYFAVEANEAYGRLGVTGQMAYFGSRAAALGPVPAEVVVATFYNFSPVVVADAVPAVWSIASPEALLAARLDGVDRALCRILGEGVHSPDIARAAELLRAAAERACERPEGRPLFAAHAALPWPDAPHLMLWHAQTLLREFRGDGHIAALLTAGVAPIEALVVHAATGEVPERMLRITRSWPDTEWDAGIARVRDRGWLADTTDGTLQLSAEGRDHRQGVEDVTDELAVYPYEAIGEDGCAEVRHLVRPFSRAIVAADLGGPANAFG